MSDAIRPLIVGAGPAGIRAAQTLVNAGVRPVVIDEAPSSGGQIYRQRLVPDERSAKDLYGSEAAKAIALHETFAQIRDRIDYLPGTLVWNLHDKAVDAVTGQRTRRIAFSHLILATGATDRVLPVPGWTLPGVFTLGGSQIALKSQGCAIGDKVVFLGSGPLLYVVAWQYVKAGANVAAVLDTAPFSAKFHLLRGLFAQPSVVLRGFRYAAELMAHGVAVRFGVQPARIDGTTRVEGIVWRERGKEHRLACDAVGYGFSLRSETQLADLAGCRFTFDTRDRAWRPERDGAGRTSVSGVYIAGDGAGIAGADAAELAGERAGLALLDDAGLPADHARIGVLERKLASIQHFRDILESAFPFPEAWATSIADDVTLCRCEEIAVGDARAAARDQGISELNRLKALTRVGMGRCQGRMCASAAVEVLASTCGRSPDAVGRLRAQPPVKPIPLEVAAEGEAA
ncbi:NAD(P)/FAD-dependent oxidoreductase [Microvirga sp. BSC39]|uniref:FAD/NAD(P)-dependent oxidoreductase n=1 Tax=Microvirga sp. BSC39 TaxID=1549810 RepID=UPI0004E95338|nr:NAD(P)/FAD-dependent oxidoreductase [Microvirga sp. BSC39]KFG66514.1 (2Fe-2S)-binding protein [Microvirga sp. BSC39]